MCFKMPQVISGIDCGENYYTVNQTYCLSCGDCHPGYGRYPPCGPVPDRTNTSCKPCGPGTYSDTESPMPCRQCHRCATNVLKKCTTTSNTVCSLKCRHGFYYENASHDCQKCSHCCNDQTDIVIRECVNQGLPKHLTCTIHNAQRCTPDQTTTRTTISAGDSSETGETSDSGIPTYVWIIIVAVLGVAVAGLLLCLAWKWYHKQRRPAQPRIGPNALVGQYVSLAM